MSSFKKSRSEILEKLGHKNGTFKELEINVPYNEIYPDIDDQFGFFKKVFQDLGGKLYYCESYDTCSNLIKEQIEKRKFKQVFNFVPELNETLSFFDNEAHDEIDFEKVECVITTCEFLIARTGSIVVTSSSNAGRQFNFIPETQIIIAHKNQMVSEIDEALKNLETKYKENLPSMISIISGPSRTADIEKTLVMGAHGPKEILLFLMP